MKTNTTGHVGPLQNEADHLVTEDTKAAKLLNAFFVSVHTTGDCLQELQTPEAPEEGRTKIDEGCITDQLSHLDIHKFLGPDGMYPQVLAQLVEVIKPLSIIFDKS